LVRGRLGFETRSPIVAGDGSSPVIVAPKGPSIDWSRYQAIEIE
jgi:hypothetical protein